jgi:hypothetical protein
LPENYGGLNKTNFFKESFTAPSNNNPINFISLIVSNLKFLLFGFYTQTLVASGLNKRSLNGNTGDLESYSDNLFRITGLTKSNSLKTGVFMRLNNSSARSALGILGALVTPLIFLFVLLYILTIVSYSCTDILPNSLTLTLSNLTIILFSFYNSTTALETLLLKFSTSLVKVNYNNLETDTNPLKIQEKYFSKYENTYFTDKKCSES